MRMSLTDREFEILLWLAFTDDKISINPDAEEDEHKKLSKKLQKIADKLCFEDVIDDIKFNLGVKRDDEDELLELEEKKNKIVDENGIFYCPKCKIRTNEKTYTTTCVICNTVLHRVGEH